jgi:hypothetical protein
MPGERRPSLCLSTTALPASERRHDDVDRHEKRIVPGRDVEHDAERRVLDPPDEALLRRQHDGRERFLRFRDRPAGAIEEGVDLAPRLGDRLPHLARHVARGLPSPAGAKALERRLDLRLALADRHVPPALEGGVCRGELPLERGAGGRSRPRRRSTGRTG